MYKKYRDKLIENGYHPIPLNGKRPITENFIKSDSPKADKYSKNNIGIVCGLPEKPVYAIDIDVEDPILSNKLLNLIIDKYEDTVCRIGKQPKKLLVYRSDPGIRKIKSSIYNCGHVEFLGYGQQFAAFGVHPDTQQLYKWEGLFGSLLDINYDNLPFIPQNSVKELIALCEACIESPGHKPKIKDVLLNRPDYDPNDPLDISQPVGINYDKLQNILNKLDPDCDRDQWFKVGAAIHHETNGDGFDLWNDWSSGGLKYNEGEMKSQWISLDRGYRGQPVTAAYLLKLTKVKKEPIRDIFSYLNWDTSRFINDVPDIPMIIDNMIPENVIGLLYSAGGVGKSTWIMYVSILIALANEYESINLCGNKVHPGTTVIISAEDPENILNMRYIEILKCIADSYFVELKDLRKIADKHIKIMSTCGESAPLFSLNNNLLETTANFKALTKRLKTIDDLRLVIIDTKSRYSPAEGMGNVLATQEISLYESMRNRINASIMILHHTNKTARDGSLSGSQAYRDATAIFDSIRNSWYLRRLKDKELKDEGINAGSNKRYLYLENSKNNYIEEHKPILINREGFAYHHKLFSSLKSKEDNTQDSYDESIALLQLANKKINQSQLTALTGFNRRKTIDFIEWAVKTELLILDVIGKSRIYSLSESGLNYKLEVL